jgi:microcystin-dependent protein
MARNGSGVYNPPTGTAPLLPSTLADATKLENRLSDIGTEITGSLPRNGSAGMLAPLIAAVGTLSAPGITFTGDTNSGRALISGRITDIKDGVAVSSFDDAGVTFEVPVSFDGGIAGPVAVQTGTVSGFAGITCPDGYLFCFGQAASRSTYSALLADISKVVTATTTSGNTGLSSVSEDLTAFGLVGAVVEGAGIPSGTTITALTATTITMSAAATASASGVSIRLLPWGAGDGSTTFNIPDFRDRTPAGRGDMGGTAANRLTGLSGGVDGRRLGSYGGAEVHTLTTAQMPSHGHTATVTDPGHEHSVSDFYARFRGSGGTINFTAGATFDTFSPDVQPATTGITVANANTGGDAAHNNVQPTGILNFIIRT